MTDPDEGAARQKARENGPRSGKGRQWASRIVLGRGPSDGRTDPQPMGPYGGGNNADPESSRRFLALLAVVVAAVTIALVGWLSSESSVGVVLFATFVWLWAEYTVENQARRDLATDLAQNIHDGNLEGDDLRRARGYPFVEDRLDRTDASADREATDG